MELLNEIIRNLALWIQGLTPQDFLGVIIILIKILVIFIVVKVLNKIASKLIFSLFERQKKPPFKMESRKAETLKVLFQSITRYALYFVAFTMVLGMFVDTTSLLATAGIGGIAIGFGAQSLVKDIITGFFILFEDQYSVEDFVTIGTVTGTVEEIGLRITKIRSFRGEINIIPNGQVVNVINHTRGNVLAVVDIPIAYEANVTHAIKVIEETIVSYADENKDVVETPQILGIMSIQTSDMTVRVIARTLPMKQWEVERHLRFRIKEAFDKNNVLTPYQHMVVKIEQ